MSAKLPAGDKTPPAPGFIRIDRVQHVIHVQPKPSCTKCHGRGGIVFLGQGGERTTKPCACVLKAIRRAEAP